MSVFGITAANMQDKISPSTADYSFTIGAEGDLSEAGLTDIVRAAEAEVMGYLSPKYQTLVRRVPGEVLTDYAEGGELEFATGLKPLVEDSVFVYLNFPERGAWSQRRPHHRMASADYSINLTTGALTLSNPLRAGDRLFIEYSHTASAGIYDLRKNAMDLAAAEIARRFAYFRAGDGFDRFEAWEVAARQHLRDVMRGGGGSVEEFERLHLVTETRGMGVAEILGD